MNKREFLLGAGGLLAAGAALTSGQSKAAMDDPAAEVTADLLENAAVAEAEVPLGRL